MNKSNVFRSSDFYMAEGDILHILILDEFGDPVYLDLMSTVSVDTVPGQPVIGVASDITSSSFTANWSFMENTTGYYLDVATDSAFTAFVAGYNNKDVGNVISASVTGLLGLVTYYFRVRGRNETGTGISSSSSTALTLMSVITDADGNVYTYVTIGTQQWLVENFKTTKYADGTAIPNVTDNVDWMLEDGTGGHDGAYVWYDNNLANKADYGGLYNWYAVTNAHGLAPTGWRIPTITDFNTLVTNTGGLLLSGGNLKEIGTTHWDAPNTLASDIYGFKGMGGGGNGAWFDQLKSVAFFWASTETFYVGVWRGDTLNLYHDSASGVVSYDYKTLGASLRCVRDI
jgi:uncharacterized protein (TIGR02145 family)